MREFMHGNEWWGLRDDGTWVRWNNQSLEWDPQAEPPPSDEMREVTEKPSPDFNEQPGSGSDSAPTPSLSPAEGIDPATGVPLPPGSKVYRWEFKKQLGTPPDQMPSGARRFGGGSARSSARYRSRAGRPIRALHRKSSAARRSGRFAGRSWELICGSA